MRCAPASAAAGTSACRGHESVIRCSARGWRTAASLSGSECGSQWFTGRCLWSCKAAAPLHVGCGGAQLSLYTSVAIAPAGVDPQRNRRCISELSWSIGGRVAARRVSTLSRTRATVLLAVAITFAGCPDAIMHVRAAWETSIALQDAILPHSGPLGSRCRTLCAPRGRLHLQNVSAQAADERYMCTRRMRNVHLSTTQARLYRL